MPILGVTFSDVKSANWNLLMGAGCYLAAYVVAYTVSHIGNTYLRYRNPHGVEPKKSVMGVMSICANVVTYELLKSCVQLTPLNSAMKKVLGAETAIFYLLEMAGLSPYFGLFIPLAGCLDKKRAIKVWVALGAFGGALTAVKSSNE